MNRCPLHLETLLEAETAQADIFALEIFLDPLMTAFLAEAGLLDAAKGCFHGCDDPFIHADQAVF